MGERHSLSTRLAAVIVSAAATFLTFAALEGSDDEPPRQDAGIECEADFQDGPDPTLDTLIAQADSLFLTCFAPLPATGELLPQMDVTLLYNVPVVDVSQARLVLPGSESICDDGDPSFDPAVGSCLTVTPPEGQSAYDGSPGRPNTFLGKPYGRTGVQFNNIPVHNSIAAGFNALISGVTINTAALTLEGREVATTTFITEIDSEFIAERQASSSEALRRSQKRPARKRAKKKTVAKRKARKKKAAKKKAIKWKAKKTKSKKHSKNKNPNPEDASEAAEIQVSEERADAFSAAVRQILDLARSRFRADFSGVPRGVRLFVTNSRLASSSPTVEVVRTSSEEGPLDPVPAGGTLRMEGQEYDLSEVDLRGGSGTAWWEVVASDPRVIEQFSLGVVGSWTADGTFAGSPDEGVASFHMTAQPSSTIAAVSYGRLPPVPPLFKALRPGALGDPNKFPIFAAHSGSGAPPAIEFGGPFVSAPTLLYRIQQGGNQAPDANVPVFSPNGGAGLNTTVDVFPVEPTPQQATQGWLTATLNSGNTPDAVTIEIDEEGLPIGDHNGVVTVVSPGAGNSPLTLPILVRVTPPGPYFDEGTLLNAAGFQPGAVSPGQAFVVFGSGFGPLDLVTLQLDADGLVSTELGGVRVLFDGTPAPMIFAVNGQVSGFAPFGVAGSEVTAVTIEFGDQVSRPIAMPVLASTPGLFTIDNTGGGPAAALNQDGTINQPEVPAAFNDVVVFFGTGAGQTNPPGVDGRLAVAPLPQLTQDVEVLIGSQPAEVLYAGPAPGLAEGVLQLNVRLPANIRPGLFVEVRVRIGSQWSQPGVTVSILP